MLKIGGRYLISILFFLSTNGLTDEVKITSGKMTLNGNLVIASGTDLPERVVLMLHGTLAHKDMEIIAALQSVFAESDYSSLAITLSLDISDRRGFYPCDYPHSHKSDDAFEELDLWIEWLKHKGVNDIVLLAHSRGANQATKYALRNSGSISRLILLAPPVKEPTIDSEIKTKLENLESDDWLTQARFLNCDNSDVQVASYLSYQGPDAQADTLPLVGRLHLPTLVISGSEDALTKELATRMSSMENDAVSYVSIDGAGHFFRDLYMYDLVDAAVSFLDSSRMIEIVTSLQEDAKEVQDTGRPIVILVTQSDCAYCRELRGKVLNPMIRTGELGQRVILRELSLDTGFRFKDFQGNTVAGQQFGARYDSYVTPTLLFLDANGHSLTDPIVGTGNIEFYGFYLDKKIEEATAALSVASSD
jgi:pimeloyl-ACP methyl ester carboxylesterase